jgi:hypothetical protein
MGRFRTLKEHLPPAETAYLGEIVKRLRDYLGQNLVGVYLFGSAGYEAYEPGLSDLDVQAVVKQPLELPVKKEIIRRISQENLPCPASKLEFVAYAFGGINPANRHPRFELNLNTGPGQADHISLDPAGESSHWFLLDIAMGREFGRALFGPDPAEVFAPIPRRWTLEAIADSLEWHRLNELSSANSVLNACRGWRYIATNNFGSKLAGAEWALQKQDAPAVIQHAIEARKTGETLPPAEVVELFEIVLKAVRAALEKERDDSD